MSLQNENFDLGSIERKAKGTNLGINVFRPGLTKFPSHVAKLARVSIADLDTPVYVSPEWKLSLRLRTVVGKHRLLVASKPQKSHWAVSSKDVEGDWQGWSPIVSGSRTESIPAHRVILARGPFKSLPEIFEIEGLVGTFKAERIPLGRPSGVAVWAITDTGVAK